MPGPPRDVIATLRLLPGKPAKIQIIGGIPTIRTANLVDAPTVGLDTKHGEQTPKRRGETGGVSHALKHGRLGEACVGSRLVRSPPQDAFPPSPRALSLRRPRGSQSAGAEQAPLRARSPRRLNDGFQVRIFWLEMKYALRS